jgi:hypothetical protein
MKRLGKVFWGVLCMILLFAFSQSSAGNICAPNIDIQVVKTEEKVQFEWDATKTYTDEKKVEVKYVVYRYQAKNKDENPPTEAQFEEYKKQKRLKEYSPITEPSKVITFEGNGLYLLGVRAKTFNIKNGSEIGRSSVSWSCYKECTIKPQKVVITVTK